MNECVVLYTTVLKNSLDAHNVRRLILHPDNVSSKISRGEQIKSLATSLREIAEGVKEIDFMY